MSSAVTVTRAGRTAGAITHRAPAPPAAHGRWHAPRSVATAGGAHSAKARPRPIVARCDAARRTVPAASAARAHELADGVPVSPTPANDLGLGDREARLRRRLHRHARVQERVLLVVH